MTFPSGEAVQGIRADMFIAVNAGTTGRARSVAYAPIDGGDLPVNPADLPVNLSVAIIPRRTSDNAWFLGLVESANQLSSYEVFKINGVDVLSKPELFNDIVIFNGSSPRITYVLEADKPQVLVELKFKSTVGNEHYDFDRIDVLEGDVLVKPDLTVVFKLGSA